jgi:hypothetical protein
MSSDNWAICPRCLAQAKEAFGAEVARVGAMYGSVPIEEFDAARDAIKAVDPEEYRTFREDYEFYGAEEGEITADYSGHCSKCALGLDFKEARRFYP